MFFTYRRRGGAVAASIEKPHISGAAMALLSAFAYGGSIPFIKLFGADVSYAAGSALLYLGCGLCMVLVRGLDAVRGRKPNRAPVFLHTIYRCLLP